MLEHCVSADHADALAGDLLENFRAGRSDSWFWQQTLSACAVSWAEGLRARMPLLLFALVWSMLAPAWKTFVDGLDNAQGFDLLLSYFGPLWVIVALAGWLLLHSIFLWAGILVFYAAHTSLGRGFRRARISRSFLLAPVVFAPVYGATMVWGALYWYSFFANAKLATTPLGQIADLRMLADVIRLPFFIALTSALWNLVPQPARASQALLAGSQRPGSAAQTTSDTLSPRTLQRFFAFMTSAGLINAMIAAFALCRLPASYTPTLQSIFARAILYVAVGAVAGVIGTYLYWYSPANPFRNDPPLPFSLFAFVCAAGWVWAPSLALFYEQISGAAALVAGAGASLLAIGLRQSTFSLFAPEPRAVSVEGHEKFDIFAESLHRQRGEAHGYVIAISLTASIFALATRQNLAAAALLATSTFLFAWKGTFVSPFRPVRPFRQSAVRLALVAVPAILVTVWALLDGVAHRNRVKVAGIPPEDRTQAALVDPSQRTRQQAASTGAGGYESLILGPFPEKTQIVPPVPAHLSFFGPGATQPLIIRFDGPYWYLQPPNNRPGPAAHEAHGTPLSAGIRSINELPLVMAAHQPLGTSIPIARCREIQVEIENRDDHLGSIQMAVLLSDSSTGGNSELYLGQQPIPSKQLELTSIDSAPLVKPAPAFETLEFTIPPTAKIRKFNEITVMLLSDESRALVGPKIAIRQFQLFPR
jgi:hypothetical protein